jgi:hypothetical protein
MSDARRFEATIEPRSGGGIIIDIPFDPAAAWRPRDRYHVAGTIGGQPMRGAIELIDGRPQLRLGPSWCRDPRVAAGTTHDVVLTPEGPQLETVPPELATRLAADEAARRMFESLPTFYRNGFVRPMERSARAETRERQAERVMVALHEGRREL